MSLWAISNNCVVDEESEKQVILKNGHPVKLRKQCWDLLIALLNAKKKNRILTFESIGNVLWPDSGGWDITRRDPLKGIRRELARELGNEAIGNEHGKGYFLTFDIYEVESSDLNADAYFEQLWTLHCKGILRDQVATGIVRELIDYFVLPSIVNVDGARITRPVLGTNKYVYLSAGSGFGKSTLLDMILLTNIAKPLFTSLPSSISNSSLSKLSEYEDIRLQLMGNDSQYLFPVFVHSNMANTTYDSILDLAEAKNITNFLDLVKAAEKEGRLLFLIDSIDEVESDKQAAFLASIEKMIADYPRAHAIFASRFLGKKHFPFAYDSVYLSELSIDSIKQITYAILSKPEAEKTLNRITNNQHLFSLARNPFMLMIILEEKGDRLVHQILASIVNAIIDRRWDKQKYSIDTEEIKLLLGYVACNYVFDDRDSVEIIELRKMLLDAEKKLELFSEDFSISSSNIELFVKTLSSQSGILTVRYEFHVERYVFQDSLVKCWLAANYLSKCLAVSEEIIDRNGRPGLWSNALCIDRFIRSFSHRDTPLTKECVIVMVLTIVMNSGKSGPDLQNSILYYLLFQFSTSSNAEEREHILAGCHDIVECTFGDNDITNHRESSESYRLISQMNVK